MRLKIGELSARTGLTVRALHHYDAIGLLTPSARSAAGYRRYLDDDEFAFLSANLGRRAADWPPLIARVHSAMEQGCAADTPTAQALAREWLELFRSFAGDNPVTQQKIRLALTQEPALTDSGFVTPAMREFIRAAIGSLVPGKP